MLDTTLSLLAVPEINGTTLEYRTGPGEHQSVVMHAVERKAIGDHSPLRSVYRVDETTAPEPRSHRVRRGHVCCVVSHQHRITVGQGELLRVFFSVNRRAQDRQHHGAYRSSHIQVFQFQLSRSALDIDQRLNFDLRFAKTSIINLNFRFTQEAALSIIGADSARVQLADRIAPVRTAET